MRRLLARLFLGLHGALHEVALLAASLGCRWAFEGCCAASWWVLGWGGTVLRVMRERSR